VQAFDADLKGRLAPDALLGDAVETEGTYEVLRHSLSDAQKRCQDLNADMLRVADANEELHSTLRTLKGTNRRLVEEVQRQTEELSNLTTHRLRDMESLKHFEDAFSLERSRWAAEAKRSLEDEQRRCEEDLGRTAKQLTTKLDECFRCAKAMSAKSGAIKTMHGQLKAEVKNFAQSIGASMKKLERTLMEKIGATAKQLQDELSRLRDSEHNLQVKLRAEREVRSSEGESWRARHQELASELDELIAKRDREVSDLQARVEAVGVAREAEAAAAGTERAALHERLAGLAKDAAALEASMQTARRRTLQLESRLAQAEGERDRLVTTSDALRQQIRESDEALADAVRGNEALREHMEVQRLDAQSASERDLKLCREMFERQAEVQGQAHRQAQADLARQCRALEEGLGQKAGELQAAREALGERTRSRDALQRDVLMWKGQHELAAKMRTDVERELAQFRQECLRGELQRRQEHRDELAAKLADLEARRAALIEEARELERSAKAKEAADVEQARALSDQRRDISAEMQKTKASLAEAEGGLASARAEAAAMNQQMLERQASLQQEFAQLSSSTEAAQHELEQKIKSERILCANLRESFEKLRDEHRSSYRAAFEGPEQQITALEGSISEIQRSADAEMKGLRQRSEKLRPRIEELEAELSRTQAKLAQAEQELLDGTAYAKLSRANARAAREALERELTTKSEELQQVQRSVAQKSDQLRSMVKTSEDSRRRMLRDIEEAKASKAKQHAEAEFRVKALRAEQVAALEDADRSRNSAVSAGVDSLLRENEQLRDRVGEHRLAAGHLQEVGDQMQRALTSMEDRAADLRRAFQR